MTGKSTAIIATKCIDQMVAPMIKPPQVSTMFRCHAPASESSENDVSASAVREPRIATPMERSTKTGWYVTIIVDRLSERALRTQIIHLRERVPSCGTLTASFDCAYPFCPVAEACLSSVSSQTITREMIIVESMDVVKPAITAVLTRRRTFLRW